MLMRCGCDAAVGCATPAMPEHGWVERGKSDTAIVGCNFTRQRWYLHCDAVRLHRRRSAT